VNDTAPAETEATPRFWRSFLIYSGSRLGLFAGVAGLFYGIGVRGPIVLLIAIALSGGLSYFLLNGQRTALALAVEARIERRRSAASARASREDAIADQLIAEEESRRNVPSGGSRGS
jgi:hypothetical protein